MTGNALVVVCHWSNSVSCSLTHLVDKSSSVALSPSLFIFVCHARVCLGLPACLGLARPLLLQYRDETGLVTAVDAERDVVTLFTDTSAREIQVRQTLQKPPLYLRL